MGKYFKSFEDLKTQFVTAEGNTTDLIDDDKNAQADYSRRSRFGRNPESNAMEYQHFRYMDYDTYIEVFICSKKS